MDGVPTSRASSPTLPEEGMNDDWIVVSSEAPTLSPYHAFASDPANKHKKIYSTERAPHSDSLRATESSKNLFGRSVEWCLIPNRAIVEDFKKHLEEKYGKEAPGSTLDTIGNVLLISTGVIAASGGAVVLFNKLGGVEGINLLTGKLNNVVIAANAMAKVVRPSRETEEAITQLETLAITVSQVASRINQAAELTASATAAIGLT